MINRFFPKSRAKRLAPTVLEALMPWPTIWPTRR
jgi:hypothetical protein